MTLSARVLYWYHSFTPSLDAFKGCDCFFEKKVELEEDRYSTTFVNNVPSFPKCARLLDSKKMNHRARCSTCMQEHSTALHISKLNQLDDASCHSEVQQQRCHSPSSLHQH